MKLVPLASVLQPEDHFGQALSDLARAAGFAPRLLPHPTPPREALGDSLLLDRWVEAAADYFGVEAEPVETRFHEIEQLVTRMAPALLRLPDGRGGHGILAVLQSSEAEVVVVLPGKVKRRVAAQEIVSALRAPVEREFAPVLTGWTNELPLDPKRKARAYAALLRQTAGTRVVRGAFLLRPRPGSDFALQLKHAGDTRRLFAFVLLSVVQVLLGILGWSSLFDAALGGVLEKSVLLRWALLTLSMALVEVIRSVFVGRMNVSVAALLKRRMLAGTLKLDPGEIRARGSGGLLALISEAEVLESAGLASVVGLLSSVVSLLSAGFVLAHGAGAAMLVPLLGVWTLVIAAAMYGMHRRTTSWVDFRLGMTNRLVERMVGHRTRMAQQRTAGRHRDEDTELELYLDESRRMDRFARLVQGLPSRGWLLLGFGALLPALWGGDVEIRMLLVAIAGLFQAQSAFSDVAATVGSMLSLAVSWKRAGVLFQAAATEEEHGLPAAAVQDIASARKADEARAPAPPRVGDLDDGELTAVANGDAEGSVLEARRVSFRYRSGGEPVLRGVNLRVRRGDRVLVQGTSGGGKSTLAGILAGLRPPEGGLVLHHGLDRSTLGTTTWRKKVASVPQFHENHLLAGSLSFNLLLGRRWPPGEGDAELAEQVCRSLGLGPTLDRMPSGLEQVVGETGWQLSHGERTRVYLARALLQGAEVVIVDESFGALDPRTLRVAMDATWEQTATLLVIAHP